MLNIKEVTSKIAATPQIELIEKGLILSQNVKVDV